MSEFLNRIDTQRIVIKLVNKCDLLFPLVGLSFNSLERWRVENKINKESEIYKSLFLISSKLFFLSNKSQEQITNEYKMKSEEVFQIIKRIENLL